MFVVNIDNRLVPANLLPISKTPPMNKHRLFCLLTAVWVMAGSAAIAQTSLRDGRLPGTQDTYIQEGSISPTATGVKPGGVRARLPGTALGPAVGQAGDLVSHGVFPGSGRQSGPARQSGNGGTAGVLPRVRSSAFIDGYGDHVRSDLGYHIDGTPYTRNVVRPAQAVQTIQRPQPAGVAKYGDPTTPPYRRSHD
jgi:hypothetical protein